MAQIETQAERSVLAKGLGKDRDVTMISTCMDKNSKGGGTAQTFVMRKDPSHSSLTSARESVRKSNSQYRREPIVATTAVAAKMMKKTKEKSKQIRNLEKMIQNGNNGAGQQYIQPQAAPAINQRINKKQMLQEQKSSGILLQSEPRAVNLAQTTGNLGQTNVGHNGKPKTFAKYLNEMLETQAR